VQLECEEVRNDALERVLVRLVRLERAAGVVEKPTPSPLPRLRWFCAVSKTVQFCFRHCASFHDP